MRCPFATGNDTVMTTGAIVDKRCVIDGSRYPGRYLMTGITFISRRYVGWAFTGCNDIVMATAAYADHFIVINCRWRHRCPRCRHMTSFTQVGGIDMRGILPRCLYAIMAGETGLPYHGGMVKCD